MSSFFSIYLSFSLYPLLFQKRIYTILARALGFPFSLIGSIRLGNYTSTPYRLFENSRSKENEIEFSIDNDEMTVTI